MAGRDNLSRLKEDTKKSHIAKDHATKLSLNSKSSKVIIKPNATKKTLTSLDSMRLEPKKIGLNQNQTPILMTTIDSDGIKSVTSAAGK